MRARPTGSRWVKPQIAHSGALTGGPQPPIWDMERLGRTKCTFPMLWPAHLAATAPRTISGQLVIAGAAAQRAAQVVLVQPEQAVAELPVGGEAGCGRRNRRTTG